VTKKITISDAARAILLEVVAMCRPRDYREVLHTGIIMRDFGLEGLDALGTEANGGKEYSTEKTTELDVSEAAVIHLRARLDRIGELFPGGQLPDGKLAAAGLPFPMVRALLPVIEQLDAAFPPAETKAA
jgi:hypothetical protein